MRAQAHLVRRGATYYWRRTVPTPVAEFFPMTDLRLSLRTSDLGLARVRARRLSATADQAFAALRTVMIQLSGMLPRPIVNEVIAHFRQVALDDGEWLRANAGPRSREEAENQALASRFTLPETYRAKLATNDFAPVEERLDRTLNDLNIALPRPDGRWNQLAREALRTMIDVERINEARELGLDDDDVADLAAAWAELESGDASRLRRFYRTLPLAQGNAPSNCGTVDDECDGDPDMLKELGGSDPAPQHRNERAWADATPHRAAPRTSAASIGATTGEGMPAAPAPCPSERHPDSEPEPAHADLETIVAVNGPRVSVTSAAGATPPISARATSDHPPEADEIAAPAHRTPAGGGSATSALPDHKRPFKNACEDYIRYKAKGDWEPGTVREAKRSFDLFVAIIGNKPLDAITPADAKRFRETLDAMPELHGRSIFKGLKPQAAIELLQQENARVLAAANVARLAGKIDEEAAAARIAAKSFKTMAPKTVNKHLGFVGQVFKWGETKQHWPVKNYFSGQCYSKKTLEANEKPRLALEPDELKALFETPLFTGSHYHFRHRPGDKPLKDAFYWAPLIMAHQGMRLEEVCQLHLVDIEQIDGVWCILVQKGEGRSLKTRAAARVIPIHADMIRLGLLDRWRALKAKGEKRLFPELKRDKHHRRFGTAISKKWTAYRQNLGIYEFRKDGHSLRHSFDTLLVNADVPTVRVAELMGHKREGETEGRYYKGATLERLQEAIQKLQFGLTFVEIDGEWQIARPDQTEQHPCPAPAVLSPA